MNELDVVKAKGLRGDIVERLYNFYGELVAMSTLRNLLRYKSYNTEKDITKAVAYLSGTKKEFVEILANEEDYWASLVQLTPAGVNLAEGDITDMGVVIDRTP